MVDDGGIRLVEASCQVLLGSCQADRVGNALTQRTCTAEQSVPTREACCQGYL